MDKIMVSVGNNVVTLEGIQVEKAILTITHDSLLFPNEVRFDDHQIVREMIAQRLLLNHAIRMGFAEVDEEKVQQSIEEFRNRFSSPEAYAEFLKKYQLVDPNFQPADGESMDKFGIDLTHRFRNRLLVDEYAERNLELQIRLSLKEEVAFNKDRLLAEHPGASDAELSKIMSKELYGRKLRSWIEDLAERERIIVRDEEYRDDVNALLKHPTKAIPPLNR
ncbi:MAG: hypothetical protein H6684_07100 [Deltaproteobacteria bacterium]|nr:hypothetical protein [bacterium]MCB9475518.1 hypothetical protein [Deltaproteobacteria bacterium]MCB9488479.1 hypothetical protein [Deltaproteobacteria bacterium]